MASKQKVNKPTKFSEIAFLEERIDRHRALTRLHDNRVQSLNILQSQEQNLIKEIGSMANRMKIMQNQIRKFLFFLLSFIK